MEKGYRVSGSDSKESEVLNKLREANAEIYIGHKKENLRNVDLVVYTAAIPADNPELIEEIDKIYGRKKVNRKDLERLLKKCREVRKTLSSF